MSAQEGRVVKIEQIKLKWDRLSLEIYDEPKFQERSELLAVWGGKVDSCICLDTKHYWEDSTGVAWYSSNSDAALKLVFIENSELDTDTSNFTSADEFEERFGRPLDAEVPVGDNAGVMMWKLIDPTGKRVVDIRLCCGADGKIHFMSKRVATTHSD